MLIIFIIIFALIIAPSKAVYCPMERDDTLYIYPSEHNCSNFIICHHNEVFEMSCLQASIFLFTDESLCLENCSAIESTTNRISRTSYDFSSDFLLFPREGEPAKTIICPPQGETFAAIPQDCKTYIECRDGIGTRKLCQHGMEFSPIKYKCEPEDTANCSSKKVKGTPNSRCRFEKGSTSTLLMPSEKCSDFKKCTHLMAWTITCAQHSHFNHATKTCDWEENVKCGK